MKNLPDGIRVRNPSGKPSGKSSESHPDGLLTLDGILKKKQ